MVFYLILYIKRTFYFKLFQLFALTLSSTLMTVPSSDNRKCLQWMIRVKATHERWRLESMTWIILAWMETLPVLVRTITYSTNILRYVRLFGQLVILYCKKPVWPVGCALYASLSALLFPPHEKWTERLSRKKSSWIVNNLSDVLVCSIAEYFYSLFIFCCSYENTAKLVKVLSDSTHQNV